MGTEKELKYALDEQGYEALKTLLGEPQERVLQVNVYLDLADNRMDRLYGTLRLRQEEDARMVTYKRGRTQRGAYFELSEWEAPLTEEQFSSLRNGVVQPHWWNELEPLRRFREDVPDADRLRAQGQVENLRIRYPLPTGDLAELDRTVFPDGRVDYELEVETEDPKAVDRHLHGLGVPLDPQTRTKYRRFLEAIGKAT